MSGVLEGEALSPVRSLPADAVVVLGNDTGDTTGFLLGAWGRESGRALAAWAFSCNIEAAPGLLAMLLRAFPLRINAFAGEAFDNRQTSTKLKNTNPTAIRQCIDTLCLMARDGGIPRIELRTPGNVKPWTSVPDRMARAGLAKPTSKMIDAFDAGRHALFCAVHDFGVRDPLSRRVSA